MVKFDDILAGKLAGQKLTSHALKSIERARQLALKTNSQTIENIHLLEAIFMEKGSLGANILRDLGLKKESFALPKRISPERIGKSSSIPDYSSNFKKSLVKAYSIAKEMDYSYVGTEHLIYAVFSSNDRPVQEIVAKIKLSSKKPIRQEIIHQEESEINSSAKDSAEFNLGQMLSDMSGSPLGGDMIINNLSEMIFGFSKNPQNAEKNSYLKKFCHNLNMEIQNRKETLIGREAEIQRIINILGRKSKNNPLLIGHPGVGKTALVLKLAQMINDDQVPSFLVGKTIMNLDITALIAGTSFRGEFENRLKEIIEEVTQNKDIILFIDEIHNIVGAGNVAGSLDLANIIKPSLARGELRLIGATTTQEYKKYIEKDAALERRFQPVTVKEPEPEEAKKILLGVKKDYENFHNVQISPEAINQAVELSSRYIQNRYLPDKAIDIIDETAANIRSKNQLPDFVREIKKLEKELKEIMEEKEKLVLEERYEQAIDLRLREKELLELLKEFKNKQVKIEKEACLKIAAEDILETVAHLSHIPPEKLAQSATGKIRNITKVLNSQIIGQEKALEKIASVLIRSQLGLNNPDRPLGSFLFLGPSGVGKTETAKTLAREFFSHKSSLIKIDMSEFMERHTVSTLIGSPAGYVGYGEGGRLTEKVKHNPYAVVLFDEIEKAHPDIQNILLQILEDGVLTDAEGLEVSFRNTIVILTSNIETHELDDLPKIGFFTTEKSAHSSSEPERLKSATLRELERAMRPELINRLDHLVVFNELRSDDLEKIVHMELEKLEKRLEKNNLKLNVSPKVYKLLASISQGKNQGARLIRRNIQDLIEEEIAQLILDEKFKKKIKIGVKNDKIVVN